MTTVAMGSCRQLSTKILDLMHEFRHEIFVERLKWPLPALNGIERDQYDTSHARYVVVSDDSDRVTACARLLPTMGAYMLPDLFPQLLGGLETPRDSRTWELSRFATSVRETGEGRILSLSQPTLDFLGWVLKFARWHDIGRLILVATIGVERLLLRAGIPVRRIAAPALVDGHLSVALFMEVEQEQVAAPAAHSISLKVTRAARQAPGLDPFCLRIQL